MEQSWIRWLSQISAAAGVVISLSFVAYEMKLARDVAMAELYQQRSAMEVGVSLAYFDRDIFFEGLARRSAGDQLSAKQQMITELAYRIAFEMSDSLYYQWELGLVPDDEWQAQRDEILSRLTDDSIAIETWKQSSKGFREGFRKEVTALLPSLGQSAKGRRLE